MCLNDNPILIDWLLQKGADPNERRVIIDKERNTKGPTALGSMISSQHSVIYDPNHWSQSYEIIEKLLRGGANANMSIVPTQFEPMSALRVAMTIPREEICEEIVRI